MSHALTLARPYARAAFALAREHGRSRRGRTCSALLPASRLTRACRTSWVIPSWVWTTCLELLLPPGDIDPNFRQFVAVLADNRRLSLLPDIAAQYEALRAEAEKVVNVTVTSAVPMGAG
jgi:F-type H+-transporting ATPase subunit delta